MPEPVIVATARSPIGRANKGSLVSMRPDDMSVQIVEALMKKVPQVQGADISCVCAVRAIAERTVQSRATTEIPACDFIRPTKCVPADSYVHSCPSQKEFRG